MHDPHPRNGRRTPQGEPGVLAGARPAVLADGRTALVLTHTSPATRRLELDAAQLAAALAAHPCEVVVLLPGDGDRGPVEADAALAAATRCGPANPVLATPRPVVDAVKHVEGDRVTATVDRSGLRWASSPAVIDRAHLQRLVDRTLLRPAGRAVVHPLARTAITWLPTD